MDVDALALSHEFRRLLLLERQDVAPLWVLAILPVDDFGEY
jgi:hypothetical protein